MESKWPSENTEALACWTRLRNVITAVSQFRTVLRQRQSSAYANSENDSDRVSADSFLEEIGGGVDKTESVTRDVSHVEHPNNEEQCNSTG